jgi:hypothetical protein
VRKLLPLVFSGPLLAISILTLSLITASFAFTPANAAPNSIEIISISEVSSTSVEILFKSSVPKKSLANYVITAAVDPSAGQSKNLKKLLKTKATGLITAEIKNLNPKVAYKFSVSAKTNSGKMISSEAVEYYSLSNLMDVLSNLPADWGNPKPTPTPTPTPAAPIVISVAAIAGVTAPVTGATPVTITTAGTGYTGTVSWSTSPATFADATVYTATITLTATSGYTLTGVAADFFTVAGATAVTNSANEGVITAVFYRVGDTGPGGGKVFYVADTAFSCGPTLTATCTYLEAASTTATTNPWIDVYLSWSTGDNQSISVPNANETAIGTGYKNSLAIVAQTGNVAATSAAVAARAYRGPNNLEDWYLPSLNELIQLYSQKTSLGGFETDAYWSSSEYEIVNLASILFFFDGVEGAGEKSTGDVRVRPVRAF